MFASQKPLNAPGLETLEPRRLYAFANWSSIGPAIAKVPESTGALASTKVVNNGTTVYTGPLNVKNTLDRIRADGTPDRSDDGTVYTNPQADGLPVDGTYYEFTVEPTGGTDHNFGSQIAFPGPMRVLLSTGGDVFFTGDHYSTFQALYLHGSGGGGGGVTPSTGTMLGWNVASQTAYGTNGLKATTVASGLTNGTGLTRGSGVTTTGTAASGGWGGANWASTSAAGISGNETVTFGMTVASGAKLSLSSIGLHYRRSSSGPASGLWQYQIGTGTWTTIGSFTNEFTSTASAGADMTPVSLSGIAGLQNLAAGTTVNLRLVPFGSTASGGTWYVYDTSGDDLTVSGSVAASGTTAAVATKVAKPMVTPFTSNMVISLLDPANDVLTA